MVTGSLKSFLNWATVKQILDFSSRQKLIPAEKFNLPAHFVEYNEHPVTILGALKTYLRSAGWELEGC